MNKFQKKNLNQFRLVIYLGGGRACRRVAPGVVACTGWRMPMSPVAHVACTVRPLGDVAIRCILHKGPGIEE